MGLTHSDMEGATIAVEHIREDLAKKVFTFGTTILLSLQVLGLRGWIGNRNLKTIANWFVARIKLCIPRNSRGAIALHLQHQMKPEARTDQRELNISRPNSSTPSPKIPNF